MDKLIQLWPVFAIGLVLLYIFLPKMQNKKLIELNRERTKASLKQEAQDLWYGMEELIYTESVVQTFSPIAGVKTSVRERKVPIQYPPKVKKNGDTYEIEFHPKVAGRVSNYETAIVRKIVELSGMEKGRFSSTELPYIFKVRVFNSPPKPFNYNFDHETFPAWASSLPKHQFYIGFVNRDTDLYKTLDMVYEPHQIIHTLTVGKSGSGKTQGVLSRNLLAKEQWGDDIEFIYCDGKNGSDYDLINQKFGVFKKVAKIRNIPGEELIEFANCVEYVWNEYQRRQELINNLKKEHNVSVQNYLQYNKVCEGFGLEKIKHLQLIIDEFKAFARYARPNLDDLLDKNNGNIFNKINALLAESRSSGVSIHIITQRPQAESIPKPFSTNLTNRFIYNFSERHDAQYLSLPYDTIQTLKPGEFMYFDEYGNNVAYLPMLSDTNINKVFARYEDKKDQLEFNMNLSFIASSDTKKESIQNLMKTVKSFGHKTHSDVTEGAINSLEYVSFAGYRFFFIPTSAISNETYLFKYFLKEENDEGDVIVIDEVSTRVQQKLSKLGIVCISPIDLNEIQFSDDNEIFLNMVNFKFADLTSQEEEAKDNVDPTDSSTFYQSQAWKNLRLKALKKYGRTCLACGATNKTMHVDHIKPRSKHPELALDIDNLQVLCARCNRDKSNILEIDFRPKLSDLEQKVLELKEKGMSYRKIAEELNISKTRVGDILKKNESKIAV